MNTGLILVVIGLSIALASALTVGPFENVTSGIWDTWNSTNAENVRQGRFAMEYGNDNLYLVSRRLYRKGFTDPWDPASRGGIVSALRLSTKNWTHTSYDRLDDDQYGDRLFSLNGRLFMLTYGTSQQKIVYHKLFFWDNGSGRWLETPFDIDQAASTISTNLISALTVNVPKQSEKIAYVIASAHGNANAGSEMAYSKLEVEFRGNIPVKATLKPFARERSRQPSAVFFTAVKDNKLYALLQHFYSEGYVPEIEFAYAIDLTTNTVGNVSLSGPAPPMDFDEENMFQTRDELFIVGGTQQYGLGQMRNVRDIWSLNLTTFQWQNTTSTRPDNSGPQEAYDQEHGKLYLAGLKEGVKVSTISA